MSKLTSYKYKEDEKVKNAYDAYNTYKDTNKPGDYTFSGKETQNKLESDYINSKKFSYDLNHDPLYIQYKQSYLSDGKKAMEDTLGKASALTGGYANSYGVTAGQNAYYSHADKLNDIVPDLYSLAYSQHENDLDRLENKLSYLSDRDQTEYSRYKDSYKNYTDEVDRLGDFYLNESKNDRDTQLSEWDSDYKTAVEERNNYEFGVETDLKKQQMEQDRINQQQQIDLKKQQMEQDKIFKEQELDQKQQDLDQQQRELDQKQQALDQQQQEIDLKKQQLDQQKKNDSNNFILDLYKTYTESELARDKFEESRREYFREDEIYVMLGNGGYYNALCALDVNYDNTEMLRLKALTMGIPEDYVNSYLDAKAAN